MVGRQDKELGVSRNNQSQPSSKLHTHIQFLLIHQPLHSRVSILHTSHNHFTIHYFYRYFMFNVVIIWTTYIFYRSGSMTRFVLCIRNLMIPPKPVDRGGPEQPAMSSSEKLTPLYAYVDIIINIYIYAQ